jgi:hypothetical protein
MSVCVEDTLFVLLTPAICQDRLIVREGDLCPVHPGTSRVLALDRAYCEG